MWIKKISNMLRNVMHVEKNSKRKRKKSKTIVIIQENIEVPLVFLVIQK